MKIRILGASALLLFACNAKENPAEEATSKIAEEESKTTQVGQIDVTTDALATLKLSESLSPEIPASITATGKGVDPSAGTLAVATLTATDRKKSMEACYLRQKIREAKMNQESMAMQLCYIQAQKGMKAGGKYKMSFSAPQGALTQDPPADFPIPEGDPNAPTPDPGADPGIPDAPTGETPPGGGPEAEPTEMAIFLDNSEEGKFKVYLCQDNKLAQKIVVDDAGDGGARGSYKAKMDMAGSSFEIQGAFDNGVETAGHQRSLSQVSFDMDTGGTTMHLRSAIALDIVEDGVSTVKAAAESATSAGDFSDSFREIGAARIGPNLGSALFQRTVDASHPAPDPVALLLQNSEIATNRSYFDSAGDVLEQGDSPSFAEGGTLAVTEDDMPKLVAEDFKVEFDATDWDCSGAEEFTMDTSGDGFNECTDKFASQFEMETCTDEAYAAGPIAEDVPPVIDERDTEPLELPPPPPEE